MSNLGIEAKGPEDAVTQDSPAPSDDPLLRLARDRVGTTLRAKWRLDTLLGVGGMAAVYAATHRNGSRAAVKILHTEMSLHEMVRERFLLEGYVANAVGHPGAVNVIDDDSAEDGSLFLVTELLDGETLEERCVRLGGRMAEREVLVATDQLLEVLAAAHAHGIVHRDLKPENVFLTRSGQVKVLDFGIARLRELSSRRNVTQTGVMMGTPAYMAPEYARGHSDEVDERTDLWACGAMMFRLLSGADVHVGTTINEQLMSAMTKSAPPITTVVPTLHELSAEVVDRALAFKKEARWADASRMRDAIHAAYESLCNAPIDSAPRLAIPHAVPNRTVPPPAGEERDVATQVNTPTTGQAVAMTQRQPTWSRRRWIAAGVAGTGAVIAFAVVGVGLMLAARRPMPHLPTGSATAHAPEMTDPSPAEMIAPKPPEVLVEDLPPVHDEKRDERKTAPAPPAAASHIGKVDCHPPYVVDPEGKKHWKLECL